MVSYFGCLFIQRLLFPAILTACILSRPVALSIPYVVLLLWMPFVPVATPATMKKHTKAYFIMAIMLSVAIVIAQIAFQVVMFTTPNIPRCEQLEYLMRHIGMIVLYNMNYIDLLWFLPDVVMLLSSVILFVILRALTKPLSQQVVDGAEQPTATHGSTAGSAEAGGDTAGPRSASTVSATATSVPNSEVLAMRKQFGTFLALVSLLLAAAVRPSLPSAVYFLVFLGASTWWACFKELDRAFSAICRIMLGFLAVHLGAFLTYQTPFPQEYFKDRNATIRYLGFDALVSYNCSSNPDDNFVVVYNTTVQIDSWLNPLAILLCYYTLALTAGPVLNSRLIVTDDPAKRAEEFTSLENGGSGTVTGADQHRLSRQVSLRVRRKTIVRKAAARDTWQEAADKVRALHNSTAGSAAGPTERTPLMHRGGKKFGSFKPKKSRTGDNVELDELCNETRSTADAEPPPSIREQLFYGLSQVNDFVFKNSYILSNIILMVWSIVFHSWITFVMLLWANLLWVIPNQRKHMMRSSPFTVIYAELLLVAQFLYGLNLTEDELPSTEKTTGIKLDQIGFVRDKEYPALSILLKTLFTCVFWVTMRQFFYEREIARQSSTLAHLAAPLQVTVSAATSDMGPTPTNKKSKIINRLGSIVKQALLQLWIWIVVLALFCCAIYGQRMTAFRITYMALFLTFVITFQMSWRLWTKLMYAYWVIVIGFAMCTLVMIYTYQFDGFAVYWSKYTGMPEDLQHDLGLELYATKDLFLHLLYPTLVVIITVVQLQIFHKKYLNMMKFTMINQRDISSESGMIPPSSINYGSIGGEDDVKSTATRRRSFRYFKVADLSQINAKNTMAFLTKQYDNVKWLIEVFWLVVEMHSTKLILIYGFYLGVKEVSVLHISIIVLSCAACASRSHFQAVFSRLISLVIGVLLILKMIYQIKYIDQSLTTVDCGNNNSSLPPSNETITDPSNNTVNWLGLYKATNGVTFPAMIEGYMGYLVLATLYTIICLRLKRHRFLTGKPMTRPKIIFPDITRDLADKCLGNMLKYLANFVFYKFGIELTFIMMVVLISQRMDMVALIYVVWLYVLFRSDVSCQKRAWPFFRVFIIVLTLLQYVAAVGIPPFLCVDYAPNSVYWQPLQEWAWLPDKLLRNQSEMLMLDFILLMFVCRQMLVFRIEQQYSNSDHEFPGGSNKSIVEDIHNMSAVPAAQAHDFTTSTRSWLDILKGVLFMGCYWTSLAIVFLAGTNRVSIFSIGYLVGSFIFLWQGTEFYLRPIHTIIGWWKYLICYNLFVIGTKVLLQVPGCIFAVNLNSVCWLTQLLGISCIRKYTPTIPVPDLNDACVIGEDVGLAWDGMCFAILVFQLRIYQSYYFTHIINESKAITILSSRGAELIEELRRKEVKLQARREADILQKIKLKMDRIKANQRKLQPAITHPKLHPGGAAPSSSAKSPHPITTHQRAVRSGDYYLFEDLGEKIELDLMTAKSPPVVNDVQLHQRMASKQTIEQVLASVRQRAQLQSDTASAQRRPSMPEEHASGVDPRSTSSDPVRGGRGCGSVSQQMHHDEFEQADGQRAGTSRDTMHTPPTSPVRDHEPDSEASDSDKELTGIAFVLAFLSGMLVTVTLRLYKLSRNYRYVMRVLAREKQEMKAKEDFGKGHRVGAGNVWSPMPTTYGPRVHDTQQPSGSSTSVESVTQPIGERTNSADGGQAADGASGDGVASSGATTDREQQDGPGIANLMRPGMFSATTKDIVKAPEEERRTSVVPSIRIVAASIDGDLDHDPNDTDDDDDSLRFAGVKMLELQSDSSDTSSVTTLSSKLEIKSHDDDDFYSRDHSMATEFVTALFYAVISNTDLLCYLLVFLNMVASASLLAMPIPIMVFLWGTMTVSRPSKTFWVTLIAYTQVVVLIKCVCQLHIVWWNADPIPSTSPLAPARIIGIEKNPNYADYDLALLLVIFFHRFVQKQMGIWRAVPDEEPTPVIEASPPPVSPPKLLQARADNGAAAADGKKQTADRQPLTTEPPGSDESDETLDQDSEEVNNGRAETTKYLQNVAALSTKKYISSLTKFFKKLLLQVNRVTVDLYVYIFLCDFINFFVLLFGFTAFGSTQGDGGVAAYVEENKIPVPFLIMLLLQFVFIIVDRALYLRKNLAGKIILQFVTVIAMHVWLFFLVPMSSEKSFNARAPPVIFYIVKCFYFLFSAHQIRCGYPRRILGNCLTKGFSMLNLGAFKVYMLTPFLFELRALMDWIWTDTSMPLFEWLKMEDIFANIYELKCGRQMEQDFPAQRGEPKKTPIKYLMGGGFLFVLIAVVWGPLALFAWGNTVGTTNIPYAVKVELSIGTFEPVYRSQANHIIPFTEDKWDTMKRQFNKMRPALTFLSSFESDDVAAVQLGPNSKALWLISPPDLTGLVEELKRNETMTVRYMYSVSRKTYSEKMQGTISAESTYDMAVDDPARLGLIAMLDPDAPINPNATTNATQTVVLRNLFPKFLKVKNLGDLKTISQMFPNGMNNFRDLVLQLHRTNRSDLYWEVLERCDDDYYQKQLKPLPFADCKTNLVLYTVSDKLFPPTLSWLTAGGVIGIYSTFVFLASRFFRGMFSGGSTNIMYSELPYVDRILQLCLDIYLVRESLEFALEEDLFAKLIFLYRSPETMIKWTRPAEEQTDDDATEADASAGEEDDDQGGGGGDDVRRRTMAGVRGTNTSEA